MKHLFELQTLAPCCVAVGHFEGVHRGHLALAEHLAAEAKARGLLSVLVSLYDPDQAALTTESEKAMLFQSSGVDYMVSLEETWLVRAMSPATFAALILQQRLNAQAFVTGEDHAQRYTGLTLIPEPLLCHEGAPITTQRLLDAFDRGDWEAYTAQCGHPYLMEGTIGHGRQLGRTVGMPTANLILPRYKRKPPNGVYATISTLDNKLYMGLTNVGAKPTVDDSGAVSVETHLLDLNRSLYGETQLLEFYLYIRDVKKFDNLGQVKAQVDRDLAQVRERLTDLLAQRRGVYQKAAI